MKRTGIRSRWIGKGLAVGLAFSMLGACGTDPDMRVSGFPEPGDDVMSMHASGTFEVTMTPQATPDDGEGTAVGRAVLEKEFAGDLQGTSEGEMLTAMTDVEGSAGYVALERVRGTLGGRSGSFVLQHSGTMTRGAEELSVSVVPDSGKGELTGLSGTMSIAIADGQHSYAFSYELEDR